jgi:auxin-responsive protein IAA
MEEHSSFHLLDLIPKDRAFLVQSAEQHKTHHGFRHNQNLELSLAPPGTTSEEEQEEFKLSKKRGFLDTSLPVIKEPSQPCCNNITEKKNTAVQKRVAQSPVVGWPPIRSFRKNIASSSSLKPTQEDVITANKAPSQNQTELTRKGLFVKINMDGVPIGRKVDLKAYDSYTNLASAVDKLFRDLLAAQKESCYGGSKSKQEDAKAITGLLDGSGEYTLVYEDNEGDRMLVGDDPWHMFVSTVKRLRVLKSSDVSALFNGKNPRDVAVK